MKRVALITGGSRGIGYGIAVELVKAGFDLAINGVRAADEVEDVVAALKAYGGDVIYCPGDVSSGQARSEIIERIRDHFGRLHVLVNNAGVAPRERKDILVMSEESYQRVMTTNLEGPFFLTQAVANWMIEQKNSDAGFHGCIVNISSISATIASINRGEYCISKAGLSMASQLFAVRLGPVNIPVYEVRPGITKTDMTKGVAEKYDKLIKEGLCVQERWGESSDVGKAVSALASGQFPYSTGQVIMVDGGLSLPRL